MPPRYVPCAACGRPCRGSYGKCKRCRRRKGEPALKVTGQDERIAELRARAAKKQALFPDRGAVN